MQYYDAKLIISAAKKEQFPSSDKPEFILVGRSNVGKSSLINCLVNRKSLAYVDKVKSSERASNLKLIKETLNINDSSIIMFSSETRFGLENLWTMIWKMC